MGSKLKTKIRRLYDITNVFKAIGLVKKTLTEDRKVAIEWLGKNFISHLKGSAGFEQFSLEQKMKDNICFKSKFKSDQSAFKVITPRVENQNLSKNLNIQNSNSSDFYK